MTELASAGLYEWLKNRDPQLLVAFHEEAIEQHRNGLDAALVAWDEHFEPAEPSDSSAPAPESAGPSSAPAPDGTGKSSPDAPALGENEL
ncbi:hypothetical protein AOZ07_11450 [Glutamicibacter halophytocola]|uniref:hypothetical protein n=1 Tax=Glutamicibacter halophytocola TaxID=1933880 RepID=UPI0006D4B0C3|nr:hypothetical protein [Glutamicibacter halophytocola]ALG29533.1 hypothetical protein AOZ07_11450 [Glutamicibacter halophytocola]